MNRTSLSTLAWAFTLSCLIASNSIAVTSSDASPIATFSIRDYGAFGDGLHKDTRPIQQAIDAAAAAGGGTVYFPPGRYLSGTVYMKSRVSLHIDFGATLLGSTDLSDYPSNECGFRSYTDNYVRQALLWGENLEDIAIVGRGVIDGQGAAYMGKPWLERPYVIRFITCRNVVVQDITLTNSPMWMQHYLACDQVAIDGITVYNHCNANNDMIDIDCCRDVRISNCLGDTDDDALTLKSTADRACENIVVTNCVLASHCNALKMGTESNGGFKNISISNCAIRVSSDVTPLAGRKEGHAGIALEMVDGGVLDQVNVSNITIDGVMSPIFMRLGNRARPFRKDMAKPGMGTFSNVILSNIQAKSAGVIGCSITGLPEQSIENVTLRDIRISYVGGGTAEDAARDVPELPEKYPENSMFGTLPAYGFYCRHVRGLTFENVELALASSDERPALVCDDVQELHIERLDTAVQSGSPAVVLNDVRTALIEDCILRKGANTFLHLTGKSDRISAIGNDFGGVQNPIIFGEGVKMSILYKRANRT